MFSLEFSILEICLAGGALVCALLAVSLILPRLLRVKRRVDSDNEAPLDAIAYPPLSVVVIADDDAWNLPVLIPAILCQDYPAETEVVVVDNGGEGGPAETVVARLQADYPNLYLTYAPANSRNLSRKKLAITIGVKAARYEHMILTCGNCRVASPNWLRSMARHFAHGREVVIGYSYPVSADSDGDSETRMAAFDRVRSALQWLGSAIKGNPWRADGCNLGYTRRLFYANKGFQRSLNLKYGDDDIFVNEIADSSNCAVELATDSFVEELEQNVARAHRLDKIHRDFTATQLPRGPRRWWGLISLVWWAYIGLAVATIVMGLPSLVPLMAVTAVSLAMCLTVGLVWRRTMTALASRRLMLTVAWFITVHPFSTLAYRVRGRRARYSNFTWTTEK